MFVLGVRGFASAKPNLETRNANEGVSHGF
jgi:hypothetical protein